ncbi:MAG: hypothetical protein COT18_02695 [Elusimicrobia bacterium CG08_land_8_20_14_0_20_59_10]|nr:MAG: hypothetical protein COT18_02695 [Elusimicrobia bacterium CG08_land_8_20_14_0_20_59_10]
MYNLGMRKLIDWVVLLAVIGIAGYLANTHKTQIRTVVRSLKGKLVPCASPVLYSIGSVDPRFGLSQYALADALFEAEAIWEGPSGKDLFAHVRSGGDVTVNLVYDSRQAATDRLKKLGLRTDQSRASYDALKARYTELSAQTDLAQARHRTWMADYKRKEAAYNARVGQWNRLGRIPPKEDKLIKARRTALSREFNSMKPLENAINADIDTLNALATTMNQLIVQLKMNVEQYNHSGTSIGHFEEGLYTMTNGVQTVDIFEYADRMRLVRVLAHEMGHALGLEHTPDPEAIMYKINSGNNLKVSNDDIAELNKVCASGLRSVKP